MIRMTDGMLLFHGSFTSVPSIDLTKCRKGLDFGRGFYVTSSYAQARSFVVNAVNRHARIGTIPEDFDVNDGQISVYRFHANPELLIHIFPDATEEWLHFVSANRDRSLFSNLRKKFKTTDIIVGKIADDSTARVLNNYTSGVYGAPGSASADEVAIKELLPNRLQDQYCFRTEEALQALEFIRSDRYGDNNHYSR